jgi:hypothetical protein
MKASEARKLADAFKEKNNPVREKEEVILVQKQIKKLSDMIRDYASTGGSCILFTITISQKTEDHFTELGYKVTKSDYPVSMYNSISW